MSLLTEEKLKELINQFKEVHGDRYDYSLVEYISLFLSVIIPSLKPQIDKF